MSITHKDILIELSGESSLAITSLEDDKYVHFKMYGRQFYSHRYIVPHKYRKEEIRYEVHEICCPENVFCFSTDNLDYYRIKLKSLMSDCFKTDFAAKVKNIEVIPGIKFHPPDRELDFFWELNTDINKSFCGKTAYDKMYIHSNLSVDIGLEENLTKICKRLGISVKNNSPNSRYMEFSKEKI